MDEMLSRAVEGSYPEAQKSSLLHYLEGEPGKSPLDYYLKRDKLTGTPYESFFRNEAPKIIGRVDSNSLLDYLRPLAQRSRELGLSVGGIGGGSALMHWLAQQDQGGG